MKNLLMMLKLGFLGLLILNFTSSFAGGFNMGVQGGQSRYNASLSGTAFDGYQTKAEGAPMGRLYLETDMGFMDPIWIELGFQLQDRRYIVEGPGTSIEFSHPVLLFDQQARIELLHFLSFGGGTFFGWIVGSSGVSSNGVFVSESPDKAGLNYFDYGFILSARVRLPIRGRMGITAEARYLIGTKDMSNSNFGEARTRDTQFLLGFQWNLGGKGKSASK